MLNVSEPRPLRFCLELVVEELSGAVCLPSFIWKVVVKMQGACMRALRMSIRCMPRVMTEREHFFVFVGRLVLVQRISDMHQCRHRTKPRNKLHIDKSHNYLQ